MLHIILRLIVACVHKVLSALRPALKTVKDPHEMRVVRMESDGNCLFRSLAYPSRQHQAVRNGLVQYLKTNWDYYKEFVVDEEHAVYGRRMATNGVWGDELMLRVFSDAANVDVFVYDAQTGALISEYRPKKPSDVLLSRYLLYDGAHYDCLVDNKPSHR